MAQKFKLQSPWVTYYDKVRELFGRDPEVKVAFDNDEVLLEVFVDNAIKAKAIRKFLPEVKVFGNVAMTIRVIPSNAGKKCDLDAIVDEVFIEDAFEGNPLYHFTRTFPEVFVNPISYVVFAKEVIQYYNDDLGDLYGNANCLAEDLARDVLVNVDGIFFSTDIK